MKIRGILAEDFQNFRLPSMYIATSLCDWKCCCEQNLDLGVCQNAPLASSPIMDVSYDAIFELYHHNDISRAVVIGGLEPFLQFNDIFELIRVFRERGEMCPFVIYTGYYPEEIANELRSIRQSFSNIIVKFGRYIPDRPARYDDVLGITLASDNQYAEELS